MPKDNICWVFLLNFWFMANIAHWRVYRINNFVDYGAIFWFAKTPKRENSANMPVISTTYRQARRSIRRQLRHQPPGQCCQWWPESSLQLPLPRMNVLHWWRGTSWKEFDLFWFTHFTGSTTANRSKTKEKCLGWALKNSDRPKKTEADQAQISKRTKKDGTTVEQQNRVNERFLSLPIVREVIKAFRRITLGRLTCLCKLGRPPIGSVRNYVQTVVQSHRHISRAQQWEK